VKQWIPRTRTLVGSLNIYFLFYFNLLSFDKTFVNHKKVNNLHTIWNEIKLSHLKTTDVLSTF